jgi:hypothetical protein
MPHFHALDQPLVPLSSIAAEDATTSSPASLAVVIAVTRRLLNINCHDEDAFIKQTT